MPYKIGDYVSIVSNNTSFDEGQLTRIIAIDDVEPKWYVEKGYNTGWVNTLDIVLAKDYVPPPSRLKYKVGDMVRCTEYEDADGNPVIGEIAEVDEDDDDCYLIAYIDEDGDEASSWTVEECCTLVDSSLDDYPIY